MEVLLSPLNYFSLHALELFKFLNIASTNVISGKYSLLPQILETFSALYYLVDTQDSTWNNLVIDLLTQDSDNMRYYVTSIVEHKNDSSVR